MQMRICGSRSAPRQKVSSKGESSTVRLLIASMHNTRYSCVVENAQRGVVALVSLVAGRVGVPRQARTRRRCSAAACVSGVSAIHYIILSPWGWGSS